VSNKRYNIIIKYCMRDPVCDVIYLRVPQRCPMGHKVIKV